MSEVTVLTLRADIRNTNDYKNYHFHDNYADNENDKDRTRIMNATTGTQQLI